MRYSYNSEFELIEIGIGDCEISLDLDEFYEIVEFVRKHTISRKTRC